MEQKLGDIASIQFGLYEKNKANGNVKYLLAQHFNNAGNLTNFQDSYIDYTKDTERYLLQEDDVLLTSKGFRNFAWCYTKNIGDAVASSLFFVIKPKKAIILPAYLVIYLNTQKMQHYFKILGEASTIPSIPKKELLQLKINVPSMQQQKEIINMVTLMDTEINISKEIIQRKEAIKKAMIAHILTNT